MDYQQLAQFLGQVLGTAAIVAFGLKKRRGQNKELAGSLAHEVTHIRDQVNELKGIIVTHQAELREVSEREAHIISRIDRLEESLPRIEEILEKTLNFFERRKAVTLEERPLPGGKTALKTRKD